MNAYVCMCMHVFAPVIVVVVVVVVAPPRRYNESLAGARVPSWAGVGGPRGVNALKDDGTIIKHVVVIVNSY